VYRHLAFEHVKEAPPSDDARARQPLWTVPNVLTFARLVLVPVLMAVWYSARPGAPLLAAAVFVAASLTDWFDGYIARRVSSQ
jgi:CDP-diacylglycerol--glycerol-3-phosphate 3-phosphatidyltransferase